MTQSGQKGEVIYDEGCRSENGSAASYEAQADQAAADPHEAQAAASCPCSYQASVAYAAEAAPEAAAACPCQACQGVVKIA